MKKRRKTKDERAAEKYLEQKRAWEEFRPRLASLKSFVEAEILVAESVPPDTPGRRFYSNLAFFLGNFTPPDGASIGELSLYLQFIRKIDAAGELKEGAGMQVEESLRMAIDRKR